MHCVSKGRESSERIKEYLKEKLTCTFPRYINGKIIRVVSQNIKLSRVPMLQ